MRNFLLILLLTPLIAGCSSQQGEVVKADEQIALDYSDFKELQLKWKDLFLPAKSQYFVYFYSNSCQHCEKIKEEVLQTIDKNRDLFYLTEFSTEVQTGFNVMETIGKERIEEVYIMGTPSLIEISNHYVALNIAGENEIIDYLLLLPHTTC